ncbi:unnamed protein product, partial [Closterium sp. Naga37s-1]
QQEEERVETVEEATRRLALVNMDWDNVRAVDILVVLRSFVPPGGRITAVTVYPSDFGRQQMHAELERGPQGLFQAGRGAKGTAGRGPQVQGGEGGEEEEGESSEEGEGVDAERLREYEKSKLR